MDSHAVEARETGHDPACMTGGQRARWLMNRQPRSSAFELRFCFAEVRNRQPRSLLWEGS